MPFTVLPSTGGVNRVFWARISFEKPSLALFQPSTTASVLAFRSNSFTFAAPPNRLQADGTGRGWRGKQCLRTRRQVDDRHYGQDAFDSGKNDGPKAEKRNWLKAAIALYGGRSCRRLINGGGSFSLRHNAKIDRIQLRPVPVPECWNAKPSLKKGGSVSTAVPAPALSKTSQA